MLEWLERLPPATRKVLIHINNTNPILDEDSPQRARARARAASKSRRTAWRSSCERDRIDALDAAWSRRSSRRSCARRGSAYHIHHPFNVMLNSGKATPRADPRLGREPLLLPDQHSRSRTRRSSPTARTARCAAAGCSASSITTATAMIRAASKPGCGWREAVGLSRERSREPARRAARRALRGRCLRELRAPRAVAGSGVLVADRAVRARDPQAAAGELAGALSVDRPRGPALLPEPRQHRAARRGARARVHARSLQDARGSRSARSRSCSSSSTSCGR